MVNKYLRHVWIQRNAREVKNMCLKRKVSWIKKYINLKLFHEGPRSVGVRMCIGVSNKSRLHNRSVHDTKPMMQCMHGDTTVPNLFGIPLSYIKSKLLIKLPTKVDCPCTWMQACNSHAKTHVQNLHLPLNLLPLLTNFSQHIIKQCQQH